MFILENIINILYSIIIFSFNKRITLTSLFIFQQSNESLQRAAKEMLNCELITKRQNTAKPENVNIGYSVGGTISSIISIWFAEIRYFLPDYMACINLDQCQHLITVGNGLGYFQVWSTQVRTVVSRVISRQWTKKEEM